MKCQKVKPIEKNNEELLKDAAYYRNLSGTLSKMAEYYGDKFVRALEKAVQEDGDAYYLLGRMFAESIHYAKERGDYPICHKELSKIYYELAANKGNKNGMYYLGCACFDDEDFVQSEKWLVRAADAGAEGAIFRLGELYHILWKNKKDNSYLKQALYWKNKMLVKDARAFYYEDMGSFYKDIITGYEITNREEKRKLFFEMKKYYLKALELAEPYYSCEKILEELVAIYIGDYGYVEDIDTAFLYGEQAICFRSGYAALRLGKYCMEQQPEEYGKVLYYLERAYDFPGKAADEARFLLEQYIKNASLPEYLRIEAELLLGSKSFEAIGSWYHNGEIVRKSNLTALYFYTRSMAGCLIEEDRYTGNRYNIAYFFLKDVEKEGVSVPNEVWEEIEWKRNVSASGKGFGMQVMCILADLNLKYHIINMEEFQKTIKEPELVFDVTESELLNLRSAFYHYGMLDKLDQKYLKDYTNSLIIQIGELSSTGQIKRLYCELVVLLDYAARNSRPLRGIKAWEKISDKIAHKITDTYLDTVLKNKVSEKFEKSFGLQEKEYRIQCHENFVKNLEVAIGHVKLIYPNFLDRSEEKWQKEFEMELAENE